MMKTATYNAIVEDAVVVLKHYTTAAQDAIVAGLYGPREARFAALIMFLVAERRNAARVSEISATYEDRIGQMMKQRDRDFVKLAKLAKLVEESVAGGEQLVHDIMGNR